MQEFGDGIPRPFFAVSERFVQRVPRSLHARLIARTKAEGGSRRSARMPRSEERGGMAARSVAEEQKSSWFKKPRPEGRCSLLNSLVVSLVSQGIGKQQVAERADRRVTRRATRTKAKTARTG